jgi:hypothetical protein
VESAAAPEPTPDEAAGDGVAGWSDARETAGRTGADGAGAGPTTGESAPDDTEGGGVERSADEPDARETARRTGAAPPEPWPAAPESEPRDGGSIDDGDAASRWTAGPTGATGNTASPESAPDDGRPLDDEGAVARWTTGPTGVAGSPVAPESEPDEGRDEASATCGVAGRSVARPVVRETARWTGAGPPEARLPAPESGLCDTTDFPGAAAPGTGRAGGVDDAASARWTTGPTGVATRGVGRRPPAERGGTARIGGPCVDVGPRGGPAGAAA